jgi:hypothetical protein
MNRSSARRGLIARTPRQAKLIHLLISGEELPDLLVAFHATE